MLNLVSYTLPVLGIALVIGVLTAGWAFRRPPAPDPAPAPASKAEDDPQT
jgi:hypothetical protein